MGTWWMALAHLPTIDAQGCARRLEKERWWWGNPRAEEEEEEEEAEFGRDGPLLISPPCGRFSIKVDASE